MSTKQLLKQSCKHHLERLFLLIYPSLFSQTLCILANIADGTTAKEFIMTNDDILQKIKYYMVCNVFHEFFSYQKAFMEGP